MLLEHPPDDHEPRRSSWADVAWMTSVLWFFAALAAFGIVCFVFR